MVGGRGQAAGASSAGAWLWRRCEARLPAGAACRNRSGVCVADRDTTAFGSLSAGLGAQVAGHCLSVYLSLGPTHTHSLSLSLLLSLSLFLPL